MSGRSAIEVITRDLPPMHMRAAVEPATLNEEKRTVDVVWTTGARVLRGFWDRYWEELSLLPGDVRMQRLNGGSAPLLNSHMSYDLSDVIGVVEGARLDGQRGFATVRFAKGAVGDDLFGKVKDGILRNISVGYRVYKMEKIEDGEDQIPVFRVVDWEPYELSFVPVGADASAVVRSGGEHAPNPCTLTVRKETKMDPNAKSAADATKKPETPPPVLADDVRAAATTAERERVQAISRTAGALGIDAALAATAIDKGTSADAFRVEAERAFEAKTRIKIQSGGDPTAIVAGEDDRSKWLRGASDWIVQRSAMEPLVVEAAKKRGEPVRIDAGEFRGLRMLDLARMALERAGVPTKGKLPMEIFGMALTQHRASVGMGAASTGDFPVLLENTLHKLLLASYAVTPDTWSQFCMTGTVSDFRPHKRLRLGSFSSLQALNEAGEFANKPIPDGVKESIQAATKGNIIAITRQALINDDLSAFNQLAMMLGRAARLSIEVDVYALLALNAGLGPLMNDGLTMFHATHGNIGAPAALSVASVDADRVLMAQQKDPSGNEFLQLRPAIMVIAVGLGGAARVINNSQYDVDPVAASATNMFQKPNKVVGLYEQVVDSPRISGTRRYSLASPAMAPTIEVAFLDGQQQPFMETQQGWRIDGVEWKVRLDYAVGGIDFRGATTNAGA